ncbi:MAG: ATP-binding protein [bacterium]
MKGKIKISLASQVAATFAALFLSVMVIVAFAVRQIIISQFTSQYQRDLESSLHAIQQEMSERRTAISRQLRQLAAKLEDDAEFRLYAIVLKEYHQNYILDYAQNYMPAMSLQALEIVDHNGLVSSSGHQRNAFGRRALGQIRRLQALGPQPALAWFKRTNGKFLCLAALDSIKLGTQKFYIVGGIEMTSSFLRGFQRDTTEILILQLADTVVSSSSDWVKMARESKMISLRSKSEWLAALDKQYSLGEITLPVISENAMAEEILFLLRSKAELAQLLEDLNRRIFIIIGVGMIIAIVLSIWRIRAVAKPLHRLADTASKLSLDKLNVKFDGGGNDNDEVGVLSDALRKMVRRLRQSRIELAVAEQKAAFADIARQVNHDLKNGFIPIRNVMQHWMEIAETDAGKLIQIFNDRKATVLESLDYLENLVHSYAQLRTNTRISEVNVNQIVFDLLASYQDLSDGRIQFQAYFDPSEPGVQADAMQLRRAFENVLRNAIEAIAGQGRISVSTAVKNDHVIITWRDSGAGIPEEVSRQMFKAHVTTKPGGTGLGLVNVKRIIEDFGGTVTVASEVGQGTTVRLMLPETRGNGTKSQISRRLSDADDSCC